MVLQIANRVRVAVTSTGTGTLSLGAAIGNFLDFTSIATTSQVPYTIEDPTGAWEVGQGTYTAGTPGTLTRDTVESSSNGGALVSFIAGAQVYVTPSAGTYGLPAVALPGMNGTAAIGTSGRFARGDHVHPSDTSRMDQAGFRNVIINGNMDIWQRGTSTSATGYNADRWTYSRDGTGPVHTISKQAATEAALLNVGVSNWLNIAVTTAPTGQTFNQLIQKIEGVRTLAGRQATLSFWAKASASVSVSTIVAQNFGTGGSPSATVNVALGASAITTTPQRFVLPLTLATIAALTRGTNNDDTLQVVFNLPLNSLANISITGVQLEPGAVATPIERRPEELELGLCQRYFQAGTVWLSTTATGTQNIGYFETFGTPMRVAPTIVWSGAGYTNASGITATNMAVNGFIALAAAAASGMSYFTGNYTATAEL
jgi:hypothetical protein